MAAMQGVLGATLSAVALTQKSMSALFQAGDLGVWYDPSDYTTSFVDSLGATATTTIGTIVGLRLDKRSGSGRISEAMNGRGQTIASGTWTSTNAGVSIADGKLVFANVQSGGNEQAWCTVTAGAVAGRTYLGSIQGNGTASTSSSISVGAMSASSVFWSPGVSTVPTASSANFGAFGINAIYAPTVTGKVCISTRGSSNVNARFSEASLIEIQSSYAVQATTTARPTLKLTSSGKPYLYFDGVDDAMTTTFTTALGSNCTVGRAVPDVGAQILTGQTIGTTYTNTTSDAGLFIINRALTSAETIALTAWLNSKAV